jgi:hypothetical protein
LKFARGSILNLIPVGTGLHEREKRQKGVFEKILKAEGVKRKNREAKIHKFRERELKESKAGLNCES